MSAPVEDMVLVEGIARSPSRFGRLDSIDILRGLAILWVITFHLWGDLTYNVNTQAHLFLPAVRDDVLGGQWRPALGAMGEALLSQGSLGVAAFMMLSGVSLALNAYRRVEPPARQAYWIRLKRIVPVFWLGVGLALATVAVIAVLQMLLDGGSFGTQWNNVRIAVFGRVHIAWIDVAWSLPVVTWIFRDKAATVPVASLWFVELLLTYYLLFPLLLRLERRIGPWYFAVAGIVFTFGVRYAYLPWAFNVFDSTIANRNLWALAPMRLSEFCIGMSLGHLLATNREELAEWVRSGFDVFGFVVLGLAALLTGLLLEPLGDVQLAAAVPFEGIGLALLMFPLLFKIPGRLETSVPARGLIAIGVVSFTALIVNDNMRYVASFLRYEGVSGPAWWFFLWVVYVPVGTLLAYPLARLFRLLPSQRARGPARDAAMPAPAGVPSQRRREKRRAARERRGAKPARV